MPPERLAARRIAYELSMRAAKKGFEVQRTPGAQEASEKEWHDRVASLTKDRASEMPLETLKAYSILLGHLLKIAPYAEDALKFQSHIHELKAEMLQRTQSGCI